jgi:CheY-like chemotaxis protein
MKYRIAIVNDDVDFIDAMKMLLREYGDYEVFVIHEGEKAYHRLKKEAPDLIILDIRMDSPQRGWSILDLLRLDPQTKHIPVIICTASSLNEDKTNWLKKHKIEILYKPFEINEMTTLINITLSPPTKPSLKNTDE